MTVDDEDECIHGLGPTSACVLCNGRAKRDAADRARIVATFPARYISLLACGHFSTIGELISKRADDTYVCDDCSDPALDR